MTKQKKETRMEKLMSKVRCGIVDGMAKERFGIGDGYQYGDDNEYALIIFDDKGRKYRISVEVKEE